MTIGKPTILDVADCANVVVGTASRFLHGHKIRLTNHWASDFALTQAQFVYDRMNATPHKGRRGVVTRMVDEYWINSAPVPPMPQDEILLDDTDSSAGMPIYEVFAGLMSMEGGWVQTIEGFVELWVCLENEEQSGKVVYYNTYRINHIFVGLCVIAFGTCGLRKQHKTLITCRCA